MIYNELEFYFAIKKVVNMEINEKRIDEWIAHWKTYIGEFEFPSWDSIPDFGLYMEQVITFITKNLSYMDSSSADDPIITASAINNYVRKKFMPQPIKKRYYRTHIAYLLILCALKPSLSISEIQTLLPMDASEDELHEFYDSFIRQHKRIAGYFVNRVERLKKVIVKESDTEDIFKDNASELIVDVALLASFAKILSEKLIKGDPIVDALAE